ncbi:MAG: apolipoprotein N-acyltransferase [Verrucomicrobiales bacterium]
MPPFFKRHWPILAAILSGVLCGLAFPLWNVSALAWLWQWPLLAALWLAPPVTRRRAFGLGFLMSYAFFLTSLWWLHELGRTAGSLWAGLAAWTLLPLYLALYGGVWAVVVATAGRWRPVEATSSGERRHWLSGLVTASLPGLFAAGLNAATWTGLEWLRGVAFSGFGWNSLGVSQYRSPVFIQIADFTGVAGVSFLLLFAGQIGFLTVVRLIREMRDRRLMRPHLDFTLAMALVMITVLYGIARLTPRPDEKTVPVRTLIVQLATPIDLPVTRETLEKIYEDYHDLTSAFCGLGGGVDLVVWPESALPGQFYQRGLQERIDLTLAQGNFHLLTGGDIHEMGTGEDYNCLILMHRRAIEGQIHRKRHLVPFGEYIPLRESFPLFAWVTGSMVPSDFSAGTNSEPLRMEDSPVSLIPLICFEDTMGELARDFVRPEPQIIVNGTNGAWFWESANMEQHLANAIFRAVELRRPMVRAANTGVSCFIDQRGRLIDQGGIDRIEDPDTGSTFTRGTLTQTLDVPLAGEITFYAAHGELFGKLCGVSALLVLAGGWLRRKAAR